jgi:hypothetical protein
MSVARSAPACPAADPALSPQTSVFAVSFTKQRFFIGLALVVALVVSPMFGVASVSTGSSFGDLGLTASAGAATPAVAPNRSTVPASEEYFTSMWNDPMNFSNPEDFDPTQRHMIQQGWANLNWGQLNISGAQQVFMLRSDPGSYPTTAIRDPRSRPLDANKYRRVTMRMYSDRDSNAAMFFRQCNSCADGLKYFRIRAGWHSYDLDMTGPWDWDGLANSSLPAVRGAPWAGWVEMMWMITSFDPFSLPSLSMDDFGIVDPSPDLGLTVAATGGPSELWMDLDGNPANDGTSTNAGSTASYLGQVTGPAFVGLPSGVLRRGQSAKFYTSRNGVKSAVSSPVSMAATSRPTARTITPWEGSGEDWATVARWDPWDFDQPSDGYAINAGYTTAWGALLGWTGQRAANDPVAVLNTNKLIDGQLFHKMAITINYDGPWGLEDAPGGGLVGRIEWQPYGAPENSRQVSDDIVLKTGRATYYVEMRTWPPTGILDPAGNLDPVGWGVGRSTWISNLAFHPHEDPGSRSWQLEDVKLLRNDYVNPATGGTDIKFLDDSWAPGTTADIIADPNLNPNDPAQVVIAAGIPVGPGINTFRWTGWPAAPGSYFPRVILRRNGLSSSSYAFGAIDYGPSAALWPPERANGIVK